MTLEHVCPLCRVYDPSWFAHRPGCPFRRPRGSAFEAVAMAAAWMRRAGVQIRDSWVDGLG